MMENSKREKPTFDEMGFTKWQWRVLHKDNLILGENTEIGSFTVIDAHDGVEIGDGVKIGFSCVIISYSSIDQKGGKITLKKNCKIGSTSVIMPGITVGENAVVGANSFVNKDIPANEVWVGSPAKFLKNIHD
jgi:acetyltransferase-like isoleucine patch superfamily enzyme